MIELLKVIQILMHDPVRAKYPYASLTEAVARTLNIKHMESENLIDYVKRFKQARDILTSHIGSKVFDQLLKTRRSTAQPSMTWTYRAQQSSRLMHMGDGWHFFY